MSKLSSYITGFILSLALTLTPAGMLWLYIGGGRQAGQWFLYGACAVFAVLQLLVQLYFFLHFSDEERPRWNMQALCFALLVVFILVGGTLWIMHNLAAGHASMAEPFIEGIISPETSND